MADVLTPAQRRLNMSRIRGQDTKPELVLRRGLHQLGFRFRLHRRDLPGCPDVVLPRHQAVVFVHGCFWHGHRCALCRAPATRAAFWQAKIEGNRERDRRMVAALRTEGWRVLTVWECSLRGPHRLGVEQVLASCVDFLRSGREMQDIVSRSPERDDGF